jgi:outer membrane protein assembly factor BamB
VRRLHRILLGVGLTTAASIAIAVPAAAASAVAPSAGTATTTTLQSSKTSTSYDSWVTFTAHVTAPAATPTGSVTFTDISNGSVLTTKNLTDGSASLTTAALAPGTRQIEAQYNGSSTYAASTSAALSFSVAAVGSDSLTYQNDAAHDGSQSSGVLRAKSLVKKWQVHLGGGNVSYPVIAGGRVFVTAGNAATDSIWLYALNAVTGQTDWSAIVASGSLADWVTLAYDGQRVFAYSPTGTLTAYVAGTGRELWAVQLNGGALAPPTAYDGVVYVSTSSVGGTVDAVREANGAVSWAEQVENGDSSSPAVNDSGAYVSYAGQQDYRFSLSGRLVWHHTTGTEGGGGSTPVLHGSSLYARGFPSIDPPIILSATSGDTIGTFASDYEPALAGTSMYTINSGSLVASAESGSPVRWTFAGGDFDAAPVVDGGVVYDVTTGGKVYGISTASGAKVWSGAVGHATNGQILSGLAVGGGLLVVPAGSYLTAFGD